jgi:hypothetical protein
MKQTYQIKNDLQVSDSEIPLFGKKSFYLLRAQGNLYRQIIFSIHPNDGYLLAGIQEGAMLQLSKKLPFSQFKRLKDAEILRSVMTEKLSVSKLQLCLRSLPLSEESILLNYFTNKTSKVIEVQLGFYLKVDQTEFQKKILPERKKRKLRNLLKQDYRLQEVVQASWDSTYRLQHQWRELKGHRNVLSAQEIRSMKEHFKDYYKGISLSNNSGEIMASVFYLDFGREYYVYSLISDPKLARKELGLLLWYYLYERALENQVKMIDMGTCMNGESINKGLAMYKAHLGGIPYRKYTLRALIN